jgi:hypothetical protein
MSKEPQKISAWEMFDKHYKNWQKGNQPLIHHWVLSLKENTSQSESELSALKEENERLKEENELQRNERLRLREAILDQENGLATLQSRIKELEQQLHCKDDLVTGDNNESASVVSLPCTDGNSIEQGKKYEYLGYIGEYGSLRVACELPETEEDYKIAMYESQHELSQCPVDYPLSKKVDWKTGDIKTEGKDFEFKDDFCQYVGDKWGQGYTQTFACPIELLPAQERDATDDAKTTTAGSQKK